MREQILSRVRASPDVAVSEGTFTPGEAVWVGKREIAHFEGDDTVDVRLTKSVIAARRADLRADSRIQLRKDSSDWLEVTVRGSEDVDLAVGLIQEAVAANRPTAPPGDPPSGADLERRRRFH